MSVRVAIQDANNMILHKKGENEIKKCIKAQSKYCKKRGLPRFAPSDGICWHCHRNIYQNYGHTRFDWEPDEFIIKWKRDVEISCIEGEAYESITGYTLGDASQTLITSCPHCHRLVIRGE